MMSQSSISIDIGFTSELGLCWDVADKARFRLFDEMGKFRHGCSMARFSVEPSAQLHCIFAERLNRVAKAFVDGFLLLADFVKPTYSEVLTDGDDNKSY